MSLCGSIKPLFSGTDDYTESLIGALQERGIEVHPVNLRHWNLSHAGRLLNAVAAARPDAILMQYPTNSFGGSLAPHAFAVSQRVAPLVVTLHEFTRVHVLRRLSIGPLLVRSRKGRSNGGAGSKNPGPMVSVAARAIADHSNRTKCASAPMGTSRHARGRVFRSNPAREGPGGVYYLS